MVMGSAGIVLTRRTPEEEEMESWRWGKMGFSGDNEDLSIYNGGN